MESRFLLYIIVVIRIVYFKNPKEVYLTWTNGTRNLFISLVDGGSETKKERESWKQ